MTNTSQVTNFSDVVTSAPVENHTVLVGGKTYKEVPYYVLSLTALTGSNLTPIFKLGYCCEPKGIGYPIFLNINDRLKQFEIGKTGMFEFQKDEWRNVNNDPDTVYISEILTTEVQVPKNIAFTLDYCFDEP